ncbi:MAG: 1-deoxy-D-xylulose-5-phosphate synthase [Acidimicrobiia bacterium]|nr:1-deoxy-D-xylulose-5-phosphate synthase [Acidimicrobiia bacterium]
MSGSILAQIAGPADLRQLSYDQLGQLADEIRTFLVDRISRTGGHLSPNLGVVELTLALHRVFDSPRDRILWDVGHQAYVHKLVTGRQDGFDRLRQLGGLSGYPSRAESEHDFIESSHASTSLSYALGNALANQANGNDAYTIAVIGDGALTGGVAYEALNHIAVMRPPRLIIVVNDNGRSYAPTVGGIAALAHLRFDPRYERLKKAIGRQLRSIPGVGDSADELARRMKESFKQMVQPYTFFDALGLKYSGSIDGHDLVSLEETLEHAKTFGEPAIVHVVTEKGRGYGPAVADAVDKLHGVGLFDVSSGRPTSSSLKLTDVAGAAVADLAERDIDIIGISAAMISSTGLSDLEAADHRRVIDTGICEQHAVTLAAGLALGGKKPVVAIYSSFLQRALDQIITEVALHELDVTFLIDRAGVTGPDGPSHHGVFDISYLRMVPNLTIAAPSDGEELAAMINTAVSSPGPVAVRFPKLGAGAMPTLPVAPLPIGEWEMTRAGTDVVIFAVGRMVDIAEKAAADLDQQGVSCSVVNARWIKPMDPRLSDWAADHRVVVTLEDNVLAGGFGAGVLERLAATGLAGRVRILGVPDEFLPFGDADDVLRHVGLDVGSVVEAIAGFASQPPPS